MNFDLTTPQASLHKTTVWSPMQEAIFTALREDKTSSFIIEAVAGSGKTTTIVEAASLIPGDVVFLAFNKAIATDLQRKLPQHVMASTFHAYFWKYLKPHMADKRVEMYKTYKIMDTIPGCKASKQKAQFIQLVGLAKNSGIGIYSEIEDTSHWEAIIDAHDIDLPEDMDQSQFIYLCQQILSKSNVHPQADFDDMLYLTILKNIQLPQVSCMVVDEAQDTNYLQLDLIQRSTTRLIAVGDRYQAIYAFRGADHTALDNLQAAFNARELPLSVCYRCGKDIVARAQRIVPHIESFEKSPDGIVEVVYVPKSDVGSPQDYLDNELVMCRFNKPLIQLALKCIREDRQFTYNSDFTKKLETLIKKAAGKTSPSTMTGLQKGLTLWYKEQIKKITSPKSGKVNKNRQALIDDKLSTIQLLCDDCDEVDQVLYKLEQIREAKGGVLLSTIHKAKGTEADNATLLFSNLCPPPWVDAHSPQYAQEVNLLYVAITRAKSHLKLIVEEEQ